MKCQYKVLTLSLICSCLLFTGCISEIEPPVETTGISLNNEQFLTISAAIQAAKTNDIIRIGPGVYNETFSINKTLSIIGSNKNTTIFDLNKVNPSTIITVNADNCVIENFTFINSYQPHEEIEHATAIQIKSSYNEINNLKIQNFSIGIEIHNKENNYISYTTIIAKSVGIEIWNAHKNKIKNCTVTGCEEFGIYIGQKSTYNQVYNSFFENNDNGVRLKDAQNNMIFRNTFRNCRNNIYECCGAKDNSILNNDEG